MYETIHTVEGAEAMRDISKGSNEGYRGRETIKEAANLRSGARQ
jgi:hypothetical protein